MPPVITFEPHSIARASLEPSASPCTKPNLPAVKIFERLTKCPCLCLGRAAVYLPLLSYLYRFFSKAYRTVEKGPLRLHPAHAAPS
jgi:hypothetical protein